MHALAEAASQLEKERETRARLAEHRIPYLHDIFVAHHNLTQCLFADLCHTSARNALVYVSRAV